MCVDSLVLIFVRLVSVQLCLPAPLVHTVGNQAFPIAAAHVWNELLGWQRGAVVRTSVSCRRTFLDLCVIYSDHFVGKVSAMCQRTRQTQPSIPSGSVNE